MYCFNSTPVKIAFLIAGTVTRNQAKRTFCSMKRKLSPRKQKSISNLERSLCLRNRLEVGSMSCRQKEMWDLRTREFASSEVQLVFVSLLAIQTKARSKNNNTRTALIIHQLLDFYFCKQTCTFWRPLIVPGLPQKFEREKVNIKSADIEPTNLY